MQHFSITVSFLLVGSLMATTPLNLHISYHSGYDSNVMRFSLKEIEDVAENIGVMGGANTFDSYINKINRS